MMFFGNMMGQFANQPLYNAIIPYFWAVPYVLAWSLIWKGLALWKAARRNQANWFIALLVINTVGLLEIFYLVAYHDKKEKL